MPIENILHLFASYKKRQNGSYMVSCPLHEDDTESLSVKEVIEDNKPRLLVKCFAGCDRLQILDYINGKSISVPVLKSLIGEHKPKNKTFEKLELEKIYNYCTPDGELAFQSMRYKPKTFRVRRPATEEEKLDKDVDWIWAIDDSHKLLYRLPELYANYEKNPDTFILKVEGEKNVDKVLSLGFTATCNPLGAGPEKWLPKYNQYLEGRNVVLIPDFDKTGYDHLIEVFKSIKDTVKSVRLVHLPRIHNKSEDIYDWFTTYSGSVLELKNLILNAPDVRNLSTEEFASHFDYEALPTEKPNIINTPIDIDFHKAFLDSLDKDELPESSVFVNPKFPPELRNRIQEIEKILKTNGPNVGLCPDCLNTGYILKMDMDGNMGILATMPHEEDGSPAMVRCAHGLAEVADNLPY